MSLEVGKIGELEAENFLIKKGYQILQRNFRYQKAEVDLICQYQNIIIIVEVKLRSNNYLLRPFATVTNKKQKLLILAANAFVEQMNMNAEIRFDVIEIFKQQETLTLNHIVDAFSPIL